MVLAQHDDAVEAFPSNRPNYPFGIWVLPGRTRGDEDFLYSHALDTLNEPVAVDAVSIAQQVLGGLGRRETPL